VQQHVIRRDARLASVGQLAVRDVRRHAVELLLAIDQLVDVRVIAATNQDLDEMVQQRAFRADLFYRLNVFPVRVPPLRERADDIALLVAHFVRRFAERQGKCIGEIPDTIVDTLRHYAWPGNVRELQNVIERAVIATAGCTLQMPSVDRREHRAVSSARTLAQVERDHIVATLQGTNWVLGGWDGAAARLGLSRTTLISRMQRLGIVARNAVAFERAPSSRVASNGSRARGVQADTVR